MDRHVLLATRALFLVLVPACSETPEGGADAAARDVGVLDAPSLDAPAADGASGDDAGADASALDDAGAADAAVTDSGGTSDTGLSDAGGSLDAGTSCDYLDLDIWIVSCGGRDLYARRFTVPSGATAACPDYFTLGTARFDTLAEALASQSCESDCLRAAGTSVSLLRCGRRTGYIVYRDPDGSCPDVYETPDGLFGSVAEWDAAFPCP